MLRSGLQPSQRLLQLKSQDAVTCIHQFCTGNGGRCSKHASLNRQSRIINKLFGERVSGSKQRWYPTTDSTSKKNEALFKSSPFGKPAGGGKNVTRRMAVLNKLFMKHITDLLATGEASESILGRGLQVTRVKISPDFACINVYWLGSGEVADDAQLERELQHCAGRLRHELSQLMLMSEVPRVHFAREKKYTSSAHVETLLRSMHLSAEEETEVVEDEQKREEYWRNFVANLTQREFYGMSAKAPEGNQMTARESETAFPEMRHDVLGLDHRDIMSKILTKMRKSKQAWDTHKQQEVVGQSLSSAEANALAMERINQKLTEATENAEKFEKFLSTRRERKNTPARKKYDPSAEWVDETVVKANMEAMAEEILAPIQRKLQEEDDYLHEELEQGKRK